MTNMSVVTSQALASGQTSGSVQYHPYLSGMVRYREKFIATEGQMVFILENAYDRFQNKLDVEINGVPQVFVETSSTSFSLSEGVPALTNVIATYFGEAQPLNSDLEALVSNHDKQFANNNIINVKDFGAIGDGTTDDTENIKSAIAYSLDQTKDLFFPSGDYLIKDVLVFNSNISCSNKARFIVDHDLPIAIVIGKSTEYLEDAKITLPLVIKKNKNWSLNCTGVQVLNALNSQVKIIKVNNFTTGLHISAFEKGNSYNEYHLGHLENNKVNLLLGALDLEGWVNENNFYGGRFSHYSGEGINVSGVRHIQLTTPPTGNTINNNTFYKPSIEGNEQEFQIEILGGYANTFITPRWETEDGSKIRIVGHSSTQASKGNVFFYGYDSEKVILTEEGNYAFSNHIFSRDRSRIVGGSAEGIWLGSNTTDSDYPIMSGFEAGYDFATGDPTIDYCFAIGANQSRYKRKTDAVDRVRIEHDLGRMYFGNGDSGPNTYFCNAGTTGIYVNNGNLEFDGTWDGSHVVLGVNHLWTDSLGKLRIKNVSPTSEFDGVEAGAIIESRSSDPVSPVVGQIWLRSDL